ncbi:MAG: hypoxanthine phosphoribosyltransferase [Oscillospiraceae bacterium]|jgi:hypoxanthine phosphoribosyltransferase|nr:hypoxanthine phosphoribosyltransferase [Oscillospiraceae bacterium]
MNEIVRVLIDEAAISGAVKRLGAKISEDYAPCGARTPPIFIGVLKGSFVFMADLIRALSIPCEVDFLTAKSYGLNSETSGAVQIVKDIDADVKGRDVIIVEDILESANTLYRVCEILRGREPRSLKVCVFLDKDAGRKIPLAADYKCFDVGGGFVVGYGLDYAEQYRYLPYLAEVNIK